MSHNQQITNFDTIEHKEYLTMHEARAYMGVSRSFIYKMFNQGTLIPYGLGKKTYVKKSECEKLFTKK